MRRILPGLVTFAPDLRYSVPEVLQGTRDSMCANLGKVLTRTDIRVRYDNPEIHEIIVAGDVAIVRLTWNLTTEMNGDRDTTTEEGMDFFRRQPDGRWLLKILAREGRYVIGLYRREVKAIGQLGRLDRLFGAPATTRNWNTIAAIARVLGEGS